MAGAAMSETGEKGESRSVTLGQFARELAANMALARVEAMSRRVLGEFVSDGRGQSVVFHVPSEKELELCVKAMGAVFDAGLIAALDRVRLQKINAAPGDDSATVLDALIHAIESLRATSEAQP
ncbi:MAG: hypothetical protein ACYC2H_01460 [Thermoplasmatota archaeon]